MVKRIPMFILVMLVWTARTATAEERLMQEVFVLETITVQGQDAGEELDRSSAIVTESNRSNNVADFLVRDPEISFKRKAAFGDSSDIISIRGMESKRIMLNLDGRNISSSGVVGGNYIDFGTIPLDTIERIEVIKGGSSVEYGNSALGGVINAYSRHPAEDPAASVYITTGGWDGVHDFHNLRASYAQQFQALGVSMGMSHQKAAPYLRNNDYESFHTNPKLYLDLPWKAKLVTSYAYSDTRRGLIRSNRADGNPTSDSDPALPGFGSAIDGAYPVASGEFFAGGSPTPSMNVIGDDAHWRKERHLMDITYRQELTDSAYFELMAFKNRETRHEKNYADVNARMQVGPSAGPNAFNPSLTKDGDLVLERMVDVDTTYGFKGKGGGSVGDHQLLVGGEYKKMRAGGIDVRFVDKNYNKHGANGWTGDMESSDPNPPAEIVGMFVADTFAVTDFLTLDYGLRFDSFQYRPDGGMPTYEDWAVSPKLMLTYAFTDSQSASVAVYQNYRTPSMPELYWNSQAASSDTAVNVPYLEGKWLKPETARGMDVAYKYTFANHGFVKLSGFYYNIADYIMHKAVYVSRPPSNQAWAAYNTDAKIYGATLHGSYPILDTVWLQTAITWQDSRKSNDPSDPDGVLKHLDYIPDWKGTVGLSWSITGDLTLDTTLTYVGEREYYINTAALDKGTLGAYSTVGASLRYQMDEHITLEMYADNITDEHYEESWGFPALGCNAGVSIKWEL